MAWWSIMMYSTNNIILDKNNIERYNAVLHPKG
jgi:hypothetical protein